MNKVVWIYDPIGLALGTHHYSKNWPPELVADRSLLGRQATKPSPRALESVIAGDNKAQSSVLPKKSVGDQHKKRANAMSMLWCVRKSHWSMCLHTTKRTR